MNSHSIIFFANGDFQSTGQYDGKTVVGNVALVSYGLADVVNYEPAEKFDPKKKVLLRRQIILTSDSRLDYLDLDSTVEYYKGFLAEISYDDVNDLIQEIPKLDIDEPNDW